MRFLSFFGFEVPRLFGNYTGISLFLFYLFTDRATAETKRHEECHLVQQWMCFFFGLAAGLPLIVAPLTFFALYGIEWVVRTVIEYKTDRNLKRCLYVAYKKIGWEVWARWHAGQPVSQNWVTAYNLRVNK